MVYMQATSDWGPIRPLATGDVKDVGLSVFMLVGSHWESNIKKNGEKVEKTIAH